MDKFIYDPRPDVDSAIITVRSLSWKDLILVRKYYKQQRHLNLHHCRIAEEVFDQIKHRRDIVKARGSNKIEVGHVDEFGHEYLTEKLQRDKVEKKAPSLFAKRKWIGTKQKIRKLQKSNVKSFYLGDRLEAIEEEDEGMEFETDVRMKPITGELTALQQIERKMEEQRLKKDRYLNAEKKYLEMRAMK